LVKCVLILTQDIAAKLPEFLKARIPEGRNS